MKDTNKEPLTEESTAPETQAEESKEEAKEPTLEERIAALEAELKEKDERFLRMAAEYDNFRRRSREEKAATYADALSDTVSELLPIIDNLERAALYDDGEKVKEGLMMTAKSVTAALEKLGIETVGATGETFDPNLHNAVMHIDSDELEENTLSQVFQKGFKIGDKVVRFAMVQVAN